MLFIECAFIWSNWEQYILELIGFLEGTHNRGLPSNFTIYISLLDEDQPLVLLVIHVP